MQDITSGRSPNSHQRDAEEKEIGTSDPPKESEPFGTLAEEKLNEIAKKSLTSSSINQVELSPKSGPLTLNQSSVFQTEKPASPVPSILSGKTSKRSTPTASPRSVSPGPKTTSASENLLVTVLNSKLSSTVDKSVERSSIQRTASTSSLSSVGETAENKKMRPIIKVRTKYTSDNTTRLSNLFAGSRLQLIWLEEQFPFASFC